MPTPPQFQGRIGRTVRDSEPYFEEPPHPGEGAPNVVVVVLDDTGFAQLGCYGSDIDTPNIDAPRRRRPALHELPRHAAVLAHPGRASSPGGQPPRRGHAAASPTSAPASRTAAATSRTTPPPWPRSWATTATPPSPSASGTWPRWSTARPRARSTSGRCGGASTASTASSTARPTSSTPSWCTTTTRSTRPPAPRTATTSPRTSSTRPSRSSPTARACAPTGPSSPTSPSVPPTPRTRRRPSTSPSTAGRYDEGWDVARERWFRRQQELGVIPPGTELAPRNPGVRPWDELLRRPARLAARLQEAFAAFLDHTDDQIGRLVDGLEPPRPARRHDLRAPRRQRRHARRAGPTACCTR